MPSFVEQLVRFQDNTAIVAQGKSYTYGDLLRAATTIAARIRVHNLDHSVPIPFMFASGFEYVAVLWGIWQAGYMAVPINVDYPKDEIIYILDDTKAQLFIYSDDFKELIHSITDDSIRLMPISVIVGAESYKPDIFAGNALIIYTSGTTNRPKGVLTSHENIAAQVKTLLQAWEWTHTDHILNVLPMHHVHGVVNVLLCALWAGAKCEMMPKFDAKTVWQQFIEQDFTLFMAVPTIYSRLIAVWDESDAKNRLLMSQAVAKLRLMVSGSAALPISTLEKWKNISGHFLLERYGMTETGMMLSNPLHATRKAGFVGLPLPNVSIRLVDDAGKEITTDNEIGEIQAKSTSIFSGYWQKNEATAASFTPDGWFKTGDVANRDGNGYYKILGRKSADIIKTGGYKVSALEIEDVLLQHPDVVEVAVVALPDAEWGEKVAAAVVLKSDILPATLRAWAKTKLAHYKVPQIWKITTILPRNAMGKIQKKEVQKMFGGEDISIEKN